MTTHAHRAHDRHEPEGDLSMSEQTKHGPWIPVAQGFLCDPRAEEGEVAVRDGVAYWLSATSGGEHVLDLTDEALAEAARRNRIATTDPRATAREDGGESS